jgi:hypothetical protein
LSWIQIQIGFIFNWFLGFGSVGILKIEKEVMFSFGELVEDT